MPAAHAADVADGPGSAFDLRGKSAVVTGGGRGLGAAIASGLALAGASVALTARADDQLAQTVAAIRAAGGRAEGFRCDVTAAADLDRLSHDVERTFGVPDIVVANAGVAGPTAAIDDISWDEWRACLGVNVDGVFLTFRAFVPAMRARRSGSLIAIGSVTGKRPLAGRTPYAASKMAVIGLVRTLATDLGPDNVRVNTVCPGAVTGDRIEAVIGRQAQAQGVTHEQARAQFTAAAALRRFVTPEEVAAACVYLASDAAAGVTGVDLNVAAGLAMY